MRTLISFGLGALAMYFLDPYQGRRRRAQAQRQYEQLNERVRELELGAKARDAMAEVRRKVNTQWRTEEPVTTQPGQTSTPDSLHHLGR